MLSVVVFLCAQVLPGDVGRSILGPFADQKSVDALNEELGTDAAPRAVLGLDQRRGSRATWAIRGAFRQPVEDVIGPAIVNSAKLALLAFIIVVPLAIAGGVWAALKEGSVRDRLVSVGGLSATAVPDFVWAVLLIIVFALTLGIFPSTATAPPGSGFFDQLEYLSCPPCASCSCSSAISPAWRGPARSSRSTPTTPARR